MEWVTQFLNKSYRINSSGPEFYDCWSFVREVTLSRDGIRLPSGPTITENCVKVFNAAFLKKIQPPSPFEELTNPLPGCIVLLGQRHFAHHVGYYVGTSKRFVLHISPSQKSAVQSIDQLRRQGWAFMKFYRYDPSFPNS